MGFINNIVTSIAPIFIATSPVTSYADQIYSIHRTRSSAGFSLDIPLIMLVASILKIFYWFGAHFSTSLLIQALLTILVHTVLLHVALANRLAPTAHIPFQPAAALKRPYDFWQWRPTRPYWAFVSYFTLALLVLHVLLSSTSVFIPYTDALGVIALTVEATLPLPQLLANYQRRGCRGFRPSVIANWIVGDTFKMWFFFASEAGEVPWAFKLCGIFQATCDLGLGLQWFVWRDGPDGVAAVAEKELRSPPPERAGEAFEMLKGTPGYGEKGTIGVGTDLGDGAGSWERRGI
ncbi:hypothetical protein PMIN06_000892 [Paraphaeosphaeria minitans]|uniref:PQ-loop repeat-containing protein 1 n=1 Tax=Paraphaeosphaeria minitans TaxID=565426 RepID=A0A9P6GKA8_9PLEO|nr:PQ-loop repeat-containing protein 1 [Paraphaeosphaeria minitans]